MPLPISQEPELFRPSPLNDEGNGSDSGHRSGDKFVWGTLLCCEGPYNTYTLFWLNIEAYVYLMLPMTLRLGGGRRNVLSRGLSLPYPLVCSSSPRPLAGTGRRSPYWQLTFSGEARSSSSGQERGGTDRLHAVAAVTALWSSRRSPGALQTGSGSLPF